MLAAYQAIRGKVKQSYSFLFVEKDKKNVIMYIMPNIFNLFGYNKKSDNNRWEIPCDPNVPEELIILTNLIDMTYNFTAGMGYHVKHFNDLNSIRANTCGFLAAHMFAEYVSKMKDIKYEDALEAIAMADEVVEVSDWYIGAAFSNLAWRQAAIYRDRCTEGDWLRSFNDIFEGKTQDNIDALNKDYIQLRMCAQLLVLYMDNKMKNLKLKKISESSINRNGERLVHVDDFPEVLHDFVVHLKSKHPIQTGGRRGSKGGKRK